MYLLIFNIKFYLILKKFISMVFYNNINQYLFKLNFKLLNI